MGVSSCNRASLWFGINEIKAYPAPIMSWKTHGGGARDIAKCGTTRLHNDLATEEISIKVTYWSRMVCVMVYSAYRIVTRVLVITSYASIKQTIKPHGSINQATPVTDMKRTVELVRC